MPPSGARAPCAVDEEVELRSVTLAETAIVEDSGSLWGQLRGVAPSLGEEPLGSRTVCSRTVCSRTVC